MGKLLPLVRLLLLYQRQQWLVPLALFLWVSCMLASMLESISFTTQIIVSLVIVNVYAFQLNFASDIQALNDHWLKNRHDPILYVFGLFLSVSLGIFPCIGLIAFLGISFQQVLIFQIIIFAGLFTIIALMQILRETYSLHVLLWCLPLQSGLIFLGKITCENPSTQSWVVLSGAVLVNFAALSLCLEHFYGQKQTYEKYEI